MKSSSRRKRIALFGPLVALVLSVAAFTAAPSGADTQIQLPPLTVNASTHIKSLNMDVQVPPGTLDLAVDLNDQGTGGTLSGNMNLPPASKTISLFGMPIASTTFAMTQHAPMTGTLTLDPATFTGTMSVTASFDFAITSATTPFLPGWNLVGKSCRGTQPITVTMSGPFSLEALTTGMTFSAQYTLPKLKDCGFATPLLNWIIPGPGNTFTATIAPST